MAGARSPTVASWCCCVLALVLLVGSLAGGGAGEEEVRGGGGGGLAVVVLRGSRLLVGSLAGGGAGEEEVRGGGGGGLAVVVLRGSRLLAARPCEELYVVAEGETLHSISARCGDPYILERNPHVHDPDDVFPGLVIRITPRAADGNPGGHK